MILKKYIKSVLMEMSRPRKKAFAQYGHPGLKRDALFAHWVFAGFSDAGFSELEEGCEGKSPQEKVKFLNEFCLKHFVNSLGKIDRRQEVSCNLIDPNKSNGVGTNLGGGGIDPWGYIGFLLSPKVVTMGYSDNMGTDIVDVGGGRMRKRARSYEKEDYGETFLKNRENYLDTLERVVKSNFPLDDDEAYMKSVGGDEQEEDQFYYNQSEFVIVPQEIVGVIWLDGEYAVFEEYIEELFEESDLESLKSSGISEEDIFENRMRIEKDYLRKFCSERGIEFYESDPGSEKIFNIPRTQRDL